MGYLTTKEVSVLWNTTEQMVRRYCRDGRIPGAVQKEGAWFVPEGTARPTRKKQEAPTVPKLVKQLQRQRTKKIYHGLYDYMESCLVCFSKFYISATSSAILRHTRQQARTESRREASHFLTLINAH